MIISVVTTNMTRANDDDDDENAIHINTIEDQLTMTMKIIRMTVDKEDKNGKSYREEG